MTDLITKLETAEYGSWQLSDDVLRELGWDVRRTCMGLICRDANGYEKGRGDDEAPSPTESVDDALELVPEGWRIYGIRDERKISIGGLWGCGLDQLKGGKWHYAHATTLALTLCAAILRAQNKE